jgi:cell division protein FtsB
MKRRSFKKNKILSIFKQYLLLIILIIVLSGVSVSLFAKLKINLSANKEVALIENELDLVEKENSELRKLIDYFGTTEYIEEQARTNINYRKSDEKVAVIYMKDELNSENKNNINSLLSSEEVEEIDNINNFKRWKQYFLKNYY